MEAQAGSETDAQSHPVRKANAPFDKDDADLIIRTSDQVEFHVHRVILSLGSGVFEGMLPIPQPPSASSTQPAVDVTEDSETMDTFLRIVYLTAEEAADTLPLVRKVLAAGIKYDAPGVVKAMRKALVQPRFLEHEPLWVFSIACIFQFEPEARAAAEMAVVMDHVSGTGQQHCAGLNEVTAMSLFQLMQLDMTRTEAEEPQGMDPFANVSINSNGVGPFCTPSLDARPVRRSVYEMKTAREPFAQGDADLVLRSSDAVDFRVYRNILTMASKLMLDMTVLVDYAVEKTETDERTLPIHSVEESSAVLDTLLRLCYPVENPHFIDHETYFGVLSAARKYRLEKALQVARGAWATYAQKEPLPFYFFAMGQNWHNEAHGCARQLTQGVLGPILHTISTPVMEHTSSVPYLRLLKYVSSCRKAATADLVLSGLPEPPCDPSSSCRARYPTTVSTAAPPPWLKTQFDRIEDVLLSRPTGKELSMECEVTQVFVAAVAADTPPCCEQASSEQSNHLAGTSSCQAARRCTVETNVKWAMALLRCYAVEIEKAVSMVRLKMEERTPWYYHLVSKGRRSES